MTILLDANITLFFGRFHPLVVHLPIGFIILAAIFELISRKKKVDLHTATVYALFIGALFGVVAIVLGLMLASDGGYNETALSIHKWTGIATSLVAFVAGYLKLNSAKFDWAEKAYVFTLSGAVLLLSVAGHYGGNLTHGSTYLLEHAPNAIRTLAGMQPARERVTSLDSALVYEDVVHYIFETKCNVCHNDDKAKGDLLLTSPADIQKGGENGPVLVAGNAAESELYRRVTLDPTHDEFMPTEGRTPLTKEEVALLEWWIESGAPFDSKVADMTLSDRIKGYLKSVGIGKKKSFLATLNLPPIADKTYQLLVDNGFKVKTIAGGSSLLEVTYPVYNPEPLSVEKIKLLLEAKENITWLDLSGLPLDDAGMVVVGQLPNLTKLKVDRTEITDAGVAHLLALKHLEYLNVYATEITDASADHIARLEGLRSVYVWKTKMTEAGVSQIQKANPTLRVETGIQQKA